MGHTGQHSGTIEHGLEGVDFAATAYENVSLFRQVDFTRSTCSLALAPCPFFEVEHTERCWLKAQPTWFSTSLALGSVDGWPCVQECIDQTLAAGLGDHKNYIACLTWNCAWQDHFQQENRPFLARSVNIILFKVDILTYLLVRTLHSPTHSYWSLISPIEVLGVQ